MVYPHTFAPSPTDLPTGWLGLGGWWWTLRAHSSHSSFSPAFATCTPHHHSMTTLAGWYHTVGGIRQERIASPSPSPIRAGIEGRLSLRRRREAGRLRGCLFIICVRTQDGFSNSLPPRGLRRSYFCCWSQGPVPFPSSTWTEHV